MTRYLKSKHHCTDADWRYAVSHIEELISKQEVDASIARTAREIREAVEGKRVAVAWSGGKDSIVVVDHKDESEDVYGTVTHNRARGTHQLAPMKAIVKRLLDAGKTVKEIGKQLGMKPEEVFRLSDFTRDDFLRMMSEGHRYSEAYMLRTIK